MNPICLNGIEITDISMLTEQAANQWGNRPGLIFDEFKKSLSFNEINRQSNMIAQVLLKLGVGFGDRVGVMLKNVPEFPLAWLAIGKIGAIMVPINIYYQEYDAKYILEDSKPRVIITSSEFISLLKKIDVSSPFQIVSIDG